MENQMAEDPENVILEMLRRLDTKVDRIIGFQTATRAEHRSHFQILSRLVRGRLPNVPVDDSTKEGDASGNMEEIDDRLADFARKVDRIAANLEMMAIHPKDH
jgi:hypothetical protein